MYKFILFLFSFSSILSLTAQDFYDIEQVNKIDIYFQEENWNVILDSLKQLGTDGRLKADVVVNGERFKEVGVRYKGNSSYFNTKNIGSSKLPFNIKLDYKKSTQSLPQGVTSLKLSNVFRDPSFLREVMAYEIAGKYMPAPKANFAKVTVNDVYLGLYNLSESVDEGFLKENFGSQSGVLIKCDPDWHHKQDPGCPKGEKASLMYLDEDTLCYQGLYEMKSPGGWDDLVDLTRVLNKSFDQIESVLDVDQTLWMLAFNSVIVNLDSYSGSLCHNYYLYKDSSGLFHPIIWDMNLAFGGFRYTGLGSPLSNEKLASLSPFTHYKQKNVTRPLITNLLSNNLFRKTYVAHIRTILEENFSNGQYLDRAREIVELIEPLVETDENKLYSFEAFKTNLITTTKAGKSSIIGLKELMANRKLYLENHSTIKATPPDLSNIELTDFDDIIVINAQSSDATKMWLYYRYAKFEPFVRVEMLDDSGHSDQMEKDGVWGALIESKKGLQYYLVAENDIAATLLPEKASFEFFEMGEDAP